MDERELCTYRNCSKEVSQTTQDASYPVPKPEDLAMTKHMEDEMQEDKQLPVMHLMGQQAH